VQYDTLFLAMQREINCFVAAGFCLIFTEMVFFIKKINYFWGKLLPETGKNYVEKNQADPAS
jgi:hypothetical protein